MSLKMAAQAQKQVSTLPTGSILQRRCDKCPKKEKILQRAAAGPSPDTAPPIVGEVLRTPGAPLDASTRAFMEPRFGHDFSRVRVHTDAKAAESARAVNALAYTVGRNVVFGAGKYAPASNAGQRLIAHELTHVVQQTSGAARSIATSMEVGDPFDPAERVADVVADRITSGGSSPHIEATASNIVQRLGDLTKVPTGLGCPVAASSPAAPVTNVFLFAQSSFRLNAVQIAELEDFVRAWHHAGASDHIRIDGYASTDGTDEFNWTLSCQRAEAVLAELTSPSSRSTPGVPAGFIEEFAQGETDEFGTALPPNRRAQIATTLVVPPASLVAPACPLGAGSTVMTATVQPVRIARNDGTDPTRLPSFARLDIWRRCCVEVTVAPPVTINNTAFQVLDDTGPGPLTAEENAAVAAGPAGTQINVMIIKNFNVGGVLTPTSRGGGTTVNGGTANPTVILVEGAVPEVVSHEVGHGLGHIVHTCPNTIMCPSGAPTTPNPQHVNTAVCTGVRSGAALTASATICCLNPT